MKLYHPVEILDSFLLSMLYYVGNRATTQSQYKDIINVKLTAILCTDKKETSSYRDVNSSKKFERKTSL